MFEAKGVWNAQYDGDQADRINRGRLLDFQAYVKTRRDANSLVQLLSTDTPFKTDISNAYAEAWALSFYLCETQPRLYSAYLTKTAQREIFVEYAAAERMADFQEFFGNELKMFDTKFLRFMEDLK